MIKNLFLDLDDTLLDFTKGERSAIEGTFRRLGIRVTEELIGLYIKINLDLWHRLEHGELTKEQVLVGRFERLFSEVNINASPTLAQSIYVELLSREHDFVSGAKELLSSLRDLGEYRLYLATNGIPEVQKPRIKAAELESYFDGIFISEEIGYPKPRREYFDACFSTIENFDPRETMILGDSLSSDVMGGKNAGIITCHFNRGGVEYDSLVPDYSIDNLSELIPLLRSIK